MSSAITLIKCALSNMNLQNRGIQDLLELDGDASRVTQSEIQQLFYTIDADQNGLIDFEEFLSFYEAVLSGSTTISSSLRVRFSSIGLGFSINSVVSGAVCGVGTAAGGERSQNSQHNIDVSESGVGRMLRVTRTVTDMHRPPASSSSASPKEWSEENGELMPTLSGSEPPLCTIA